MKQRICLTYCIWNCASLQERNRYNGMSSAPLSVKTTSIQVSITNYAEKKSANLPIDMYFAPIPGSNILKAGCLVTLVLQFIYFTPRRALRTQLAGLRSLLQAAGVSTNVQDEIPLDARTASRLFNVQPITDQYIACPSCHSPYPYNPGDNARTSIERCPYRRTLNSEICETSLWKIIERIPGNPLFTPRMKYLHQDLKAWLGRLLCRKDMEKILDSRPYILPDNPNIGIDDIWLSKAFLDLKDPLGAPFYPGCNGEGRLIFALASTGPGCSDITQLLYSLRYRLSRFQYN